MKRSEIDQKISLLNHILIQIENVRTNEENTHFDPKEFELMLEEYFSLVSNNSETVFAQSHFINSNNFKEKEQKSDKLSTLSKSSIK